jgi:radical SAM protein with 4Fe4S-binding SPASM domain
MKRVFKAPGYNMVFDPETGVLARWGNTFEEDPTMCPVGPEIADIEISTVCNGIGKDMASRVPCAWCYKSNTGVGENMSLETFKKVFAKFPKTLTQIAFGIGDLDGNPDLYQIMYHCRENGVVPNITTNGMGINEIAPGYDLNTHADLLAHYCGAVAVSHYGMDDLCFDTIEALTSRGLKQVNIHKLLAKETVKSCYDLIDKVAADPRTSKLKAIVFLLLKPKGDRNRLTPIKDHTVYKELIEYATSKGIAVGMDSCSAPMVLKSVDASVIPSIEPCESTLFSIYVNTKGELFPCSFTEGTKGWETGIDLTGDGWNDSIRSAKEFWYNPRVVAFREGLLNSSQCGDCSVQPHCRSCPVYDVTTCQPKPHLNPKLPVIQ